MIATPTNQPRWLPSRLWPTWLALVVLWALTLTNQVWVYALLFIGWAIYDITTGESNFIQRTTRQDNPVTFWVIVSTWVALSILWIVYPS